MWIDARWIRGALIVSILGNLFLLGVATGHFFADHARPANGLGRLGLIRPALLSPPERKAFMAAMKPHRAEIEAKRQGARDARLGVEQAVSAPAFDRTKVEASFAEVRRATAASQEAVQAGLIDALATLSPEARAKLFAKVAAKSAPKDKGE